MEEIVKDLGFTFTRPLSVETARKVHGRVLAYIGDSVFELSVRLRHFFNSGPATGKIHGTVVHIVCADNQAELFDRLYDTVPDEEKNLMRLWRNMKLPRKINLSRVVYAKSTSFEAYIGYLFLCGRSDCIDTLTDQACRIAGATEPSDAEEITTDDN
jgi:ribonuclease-3 family protein